MVISKTISVQNVMEIVLVSLYEVGDLFQPTSKTYTKELLLKMFMASLDVFTSEVIIETNTLQRRYFKKEESEEKKMEIRKEKISEGNSKDLQSKKYSYL